MTDLLRCVRQRSCDGTLTPVIRQSDVQSINGSILPVSQQSDALQSITFIASGTGTPFQIVFSVTQVPINKVRDIPID